MLFYQWYIECSSLILKCINIFINSFRKFPHIWRIMLRPSSELYLDLKIMNISSFPTQNYNNCLYVGTTLSAGRHPDWNISNICNLKTVFRWISRYPGCYYIFKTVWLCKFWQGFCIVFIVFCKIFPKAMIYNYVSESLETKFAEASQEKYSLSWLDGHKLCSYWYFMRWSLL